jgi:hypothetical protein
MYGCARCFLHQTTRTLIQRGCNIDELNLNKEIPLITECISHTLITMRFISVVLNFLAEVFGTAINASSGKLYINTAFVQK